MAKMFNDHLKHSIRVVEHLIIPEPQNAKPLLLKPLVSGLIRFAVSMLPAIDLNDEAPFKADEINDVSPNRHLTLEFEALKSVGAQPIPELPLGIRHIGAQSFGLIPRHAPSPVSPANAGDPPSPAKRSFAALGGEGKRKNHSAASGVIRRSSSTGGGVRLGAMASSPIWASRSRASWASRCRFHMLA